MRWSAAVRAWGFDAAVALVGLCLAVDVSWLQPSSVGTPVVGPEWLRVVFPVLLAVPLLWRRRTPLAAFVITMGVLLLQSLVTENSPEGLQVIFCVGVGIYSVGAYSSRRRAGAGLAVGVAGFAGYALSNADIRTGESSQLWSGAFFAAALVAAWLAGVYVAARRTESAQVALRQQLESDAQRAIADERTRLARELHDVVAHNLSVVVLQAAGARARGGGTAADALEKIERSGRESLIEMRRLLGVFRESGDSTTLTPQPGLGELADLVRRVGDAGLPVSLTVTSSCPGDGATPDDLAELSPALQLSAYRIVQESLTNVVKHGGQARASVTVAISPEQVSIEVVDDGAGPASDREGGNGIVGMRERVTMFGGRLEAGRRASGGFRVHAVLPREDAS